MYEDFFEELDDKDAVVDDTLERLLGDEEMYVKFLSRLPDDQSVVKLRAAVDAKDAKAAEAAVHTLKGQALNLGLLPLVDVCMDMLLDFRAGNTEDAYAQIGAVEESFSAWSKLIRKYCPEALA